MSLNNDDFIKVLLQHSACSKAVYWAEDKTEEEAWQKCEDPGWMLWLATIRPWATQSQRVLAYCACVEKILPYVGKFADGLSKTIEACRNWANNPSGESLRLANNSICGCYCKVLDCYDYMAYGAPGIFHWCNKTLKEWDVNTDFESYYTIISIRSLCVINTYLLSDDLNICDFSEITSAVANCTYKKTLNTPKSFEQNLLPYVLARNEYFNVLENMCNEIRKIIPSTLVDKKYFSNSVEVKKIENDFSILYL